MSQHTLSLYIHNKCLWHNMPIYYPELLQAIPLHKVAFWKKLTDYTVGSDSSIIFNSPSVPLLHLAGWYAPDGGVSAQQFWSDLVGAAAATWRPWRCSSINLLLCKCVYLPSFSLIVLNFCSMYNTNNRAHILSLANIWSTSRQILCYYAFWPQGK